MAIPLGNTMCCVNSANLRRSVTGACLAVVLAAAASYAQREAPEGRSPRNANYAIEVRLDVEGKTLAGRQIVEWTNIQDRSTAELWFHLYWNAWRNNRSTWMLEDRIRGRSDLGDAISEKDWGWIEIDQILLRTENGAKVDLQPSLRFAAPDDGNTEDRTVAVADLPEPVMPGASIEIEILWRAKIPRTFARTGFRGNFYFIAHWFPKLGVFEESGWNCHQYHASTEYFSDYGVYDVSITAPREFVVGATGREVETVDAGEDTTTHRFIEEDVHAFTWTASPDYIVLSERFQSAGLPGVDLTLLIQPEHLAQAERHFRATKVALDRYGRWYGPYPYPHLTIVDPAWGSGAGGMEYPTLFTAGTRIFNPFGGGSPESVTVHEAGHQFWYALVGNNEFEHAWLDEGVNTFSQARVLAEEYGPRSYVHRFFSPSGTKAGGFLPLILEGFGYGRSTLGNRVDRYRSLATIDRQDTPSFRYFPSASGSLSYSKTALWLGTLERYLGWEALQPALSEFFETNRYSHPEPEDFMSTLSEVVGRDLTWFFDQVYRSSAAFDYGIESAVSFPLQPEGFFEDASGLTYRRGGDGDEARETTAEREPYRSEVVVRRYGGGVFPVDVLLVFEDGESVRYSWDGEDRWRLFVEEREAKLDFATVDPEEILLLDLRRMNNSRKVEADAASVSLKWSSRWMIWFEDFLSTLAFYG